MSTRASEPSDPASLPCTQQEREQVSGISPRSGSSDKKTDCTVDGLGMKESLSASKTIRQTLPQTTPDGTGHRCLADDSKNPMALRNGVDVAVAPDTQPSGTRHLKDKEDIEAHEQGAPSLPSGLAGDPRLAHTRPEDKYQRADILSQPDHVCKIGNHGMHSPSPQGKASEADSGEVSPHLSRTLTNAGDDTLCRQDDDLTRALESSPSSPISGATCARAMAVQAPSHSYKVDGGASCSECPGVNREWVQYVSPEGYPYILHPATGESKWVTSHSDGNSGLDDLVHPEVEGDMTLDWSRNDEASRDEIEMHNPTTWDPCHAEEVATREELSMDALPSSRTVFDPDARNLAGETPLHLAATRQSLEGMSLLVLRGADMNAMDRRGRTPLHASCGNQGDRGRGGTEKNARECVKFLLSVGARTDARDSTGRTPLHLAVESGTVAAIEALVEAGATAVADDAGNTPLHLAAVTGDVIAMQLLVRGEEQATPDAALSFHGPEAIRANDCLCREEQCLNQKVSSWPENEGTYGASPGKDTAAIDYDLPEDMTEDVLVTVGDCTGRQSIVRNGPHWKFPSTSPISGSASRMEKPVVHQAANDGVLENRTLMSPTKIYERSVRCSTTRMVLLRDPRQPQYSPPDTYLIRNPGGDLIVRATDNGQRFARKAGIASRGKPEEMASGYQFACMPESMVALDEEDPVRDASVEREQSCAHPGFPDQVRGLSATYVSASPQESSIKDGGDLRVFSEQASRSNPTRSAIGVEKRGGRAASGGQKRSGGSRRRKDLKRQKSITAASHGMSSPGEDFVRLHLHKNAYSLSKNSAGSRAFVNGNLPSIGAAPGGGSFAPRNRSGGALDPSRRLGPMGGRCYFADSLFARHPEEHDPKKVVANGYQLHSRKKVVKEPIPWGCGDNLGSNARHERPTEEEAPKGFVEAAERSKLSHADSTMAGNDGGVWIDYETLSGEEQEIIPAVPEAPRHRNTIIGSSLFVGFPKALWKSVERLVGSFIGIAPGSSPLAASGREEGFDGRGRSASSSETNDDQEEESSSGPTGTDDDGLDDGPIATKNYVRGHQSSNIPGCSLAFQAPRFEAYNAINDGYEVLASDEVDPSEGSRRTTTTRCPGWSVRSYNNPAVGAVAESRMASRAAVKERRRRSLKPPADVLVALERMNQERRIRKETGCGRGLAVLS